MKLPDKRAFGKFVAGHHLGGTKDKVRKVAVKGFKVVGIGGIGVLYLQGAGVVDFSDAIQEVDAIEPEDLPEDIQTHDIEDKVKEFDNIFPGIKNIPDDDKAKVVNYFAAINDSVKDEPENWKDANWRNQKLQSLMIEHLDSSPYSSYENGELVENKNILAEKSLLNTVVDMLYAAKYSGDEEVYKKIARVSDYLYKIKDNYTEIKYKPDFALVTPVPHGDNITDSHRNAFDSVDLSYVMRGSGLYYNTELRIFSGVMKDIKINILNGNEDQALKIANEWEVSLVKGEDGLYDIITGKEEILKFVKNLQTKNLEDKSKYSGLRDKQIKSGEEIRIDLDNINIAVDVLSTREIVDVVKAGAAIEVVDYWLEPGKVYGTPENPFPSANHNFIGLLPIGNPDNYQNPTPLHKELFEEQNIIYLNLINTQGKYTSGEAFISELYDSIWAFDNFKESIQQKAAKPFFDLSEDNSAYKTSDNNVMQQEKDGRERDSLDISKQLENIAKENWGIIAGAASAILIGVLAIKSKFMKR